MKVGAFLLGALTTAGMILFAVSGSREKDVARDIVIVPGPQGTAAPAVRGSSRPALFPAESATVRLASNVGPRPPVGSALQLGAQRRPVERSWQNDTDPGIWATAAEFSDVD